MSYNILNKNVNFQGVTQGTIEDIVDTHSGQSITGSKDFLTLTGSNVYVKNNLGIGTASPSEPLHIITTGNGGIEIEAASGAATLTFDMASNDEGRILFKEATESRASIIYDGTGAHSMIFKGRGTNAEVMRINSSGKLGIGTNNPPEILSVAGNISGSGNVSVVGNIAGAAITGTTISGSGVISGSAFYGAASGITGIESAVTLKANGGLANSSGLTIDITNATIETSADNTDYLLIYDGSGLKRITCEKVAALSSPSDWTGGTLANNRIITAAGADTMQGEANLTFDGTDLLLTGNMSGSGNLQAGGTLQIAGDITGSSTLYVKSSNSRVGIGTASPYADLEVVGSGGSSDTVRISHPEAVYNSTNPFLSLNYNDSQQTLNVYSDGSNHWNIKASANDIRIDTVGGNNLILEESGGKVGIGVTDPDSKLEIYDTGTQLKLSYDDSNAVTFVVNNAGKLTVNTGGDMEIPGNLAIGGNTTIGNAAGDTLTINPSSITISNVAAGTLNNADSYLGVNSSGALVLTSSAGGGGGGSTDIDGLTELAATPHATDDEYMISDDGTEKRISVTNAANGAFALVSGDATIAAGGALTIAANAIEGSMLNSNVAGSGIDYTSNELRVDVSDFMTNGANNYIVTATGADAMNAEANLTFDGTLLTGTNATASFAHYGAGTLTGIGDVQTGYYNASGSGTEVFLQFNNKGDLDPLFGITGVDHASIPNTVLTTCQISSSANISGSAFYGDGSNLTGITTSLDIDGLGALGGTGVAQSDNFLISDGGTEKKITASNLEDWIFGNVSGDATIAAGGALTIASNAVQTGMVHDDVATELAGDGLVASSGVMAVQVSGAVHITSDKVAITGSIAGNGLEYAGGVNSISALEVKVSDFMSNGSNNRIVTAGDANSMNAEANLTFDGTTLELTGNIQFSQPADISNDTASGEIVNFGGGTTTAGKLYFFNTSGNWDLTDSNIAVSGSSNLLGIALGSSPTTNGMLVRGMFDANSYLSNFTSSLPVYMSETAGEMTTTAPAIHGVVKRLVGYCTNTSKVMYFSPSTEFTDIVNIPYPTQYWDGSSTSAQIGSNSFSRATIATDNGKYEDGFVDFGSSGNTEPALFTTAIDLSTSATGQAGVYTFSMWFYSKRTGSDWGTLLRQESGGTPTTTQWLPIVTKDTDDLLGVFTEYDGGTFYSSGYDMTTHETTSWVYIAVVANGANSKFYINGTYVGTAGAVVTTSVKELGAYDGDDTQTFAEGIDEFAYWDSALTDAEIKGIYNSPSKLSVLLR